ncbi:hypothetical protein LguiB_013218 [Lonicera macranthoides]
MPFQFVECSNPPTVVPPWLVGGQLAAFFHSLDEGNGKVGHVNQANNMYLFPGRLRGVAFHILKKQMVIVEIEKAKGVAQNKEKTKDDAFKDEVMASGSKHTSHTIICALIIGPYDLCFLYHASTCPFLQIFLDNFWLTSSVFFKNWFCILRVNQRFLICMDKVKIPKQFCIPVLDPEMAKFEKGLNWKCPCGLTSSHLECQVGSPLLHVNWGGKKVRIETESRVIFRCKFGDDAAVLSLNSGSSFNDLCEVIRSKFIGLAMADFTVKYVFPGSEPCVLFSDKDMGFMFAFIPIVMVEHVELIVQLTKGSSVMRTDVILNVDPKFSLDIDVDAREQSGGRVFLCEA